MAFTSSARNSMYVFSGTLISRILGFIRVVLIGTTLGYTRLADSYNLANETPNMMYELILGSLIASTMIPFFVQQYKNNDDKADRALVSFVLLAAAGLTFVALAFSPLIAHAMTALNETGSADAQANLVLFFLLFFIPQIFFYALTATMQAFLAARSRFIAAAFVPIANNVVVIGVLLFIRTHLDELERNLSDLRSVSSVKLLAFGTTFGVVTITLLLFIAYIRAGGRLSFTSIVHPSVRRLLSRSKWMVAYACTNQLALFGIIALTNSYQGGVAMYLVAWSFFQLPHGLIANSIMTTMIPRITHTLSFGQHADDVIATEDTITLTRQSATGLTLAMSSVAAVFIAIASPAIVLLISHGNISTEQGEHTARVLIAFVIFLPAFSLYLFCVRLANSLNDTRTIFGINVIQNLLNIVLAILLRNSFTTVGIAFAFSLSYFLVIPLSLIALRRRLHSSVLNVRTVVIMVGSSVCAATVGYYASVSVESHFPAILAGGTIATFILVIGGFFARKPLAELKALVYSPRV